MTRMDLDETLSGMATGLPRSVAAEAERIADETMPKRLRDGRKVRARWLLPVCVAGGVLLTAGASTAVIAMSHWAGVSMPLENVRSNEPIPVEWVTANGHEEDCRAWIELRNAEPGDQTALDEAIMAHDWTGLGQRLYDTAPVHDAGDEDGEDRVYDGLGPVIRTFAEQTFPGIEWLGEGNSEGASSDREARAVDAWGVKCGPAT